MQFGEGGAGVGHHGGDPAGHRRDPVVQPADLCHQLYRQGPQRPAQGRPRPDGAQGRRGGVGGQLAGQASGHELGDQGVQPVDGLAAGAHQVFSVFDQGPQWMIESPRVWWRLD